MEEKEGLYREICRKEKPSLAPGAENFLQFLADRGIPRTIATASGVSNVDFFFSFFPLHRWFDQVDRSMF